MCVCCSCHSRLLLLSPGCTIFLLDPSHTLSIRSHSSLLALTISTVLFPVLQDTKGWVAFLQQWVAPERFGFEKLDSINYYTKKLIELNQKVGDIL